MEKEYLTVKDIMDLFNLSRSTVYRHIKNGYFPSIKVGRRILIPADLLEKFLEKKVEVSIQKTRENRKRAQLRNKTLVEFWQEIEGKG